MRGNVREPQDHQTLQKDHLCANWLYCRSKLITTNMELLINRKIAWNSVFGMRCGDDLDKAVATASSERSTRQKQSRHKPGSEAYLREDKGSINTWINRAVTLNCPGYTWSFSYFPQLLINCSDWCNVLSVNDMLQSLI